MDVGLTAAFWSVSMLFVLTPGVDWAYVISAGLRRKGVLPAVLGMLAGHLTATVVVAAGVATVLAGSPAAMAALTAAGAGYLIWLGISALRHPAVLDLHGQNVSVATRRLFAKGIGISLLNPKVFLLFLALLPQFAAPSVALPIGAQMVVLGALHVANCAIVYFAVGFGAAKVLTHRPRAAKAVGIVSGVVMIILGLALIIEKAVELV